MSSRGVENQQPGRRSARRQSIFAGDQLRACCRVATWALSSRHRLPHFPVQCRGGGDCASPGRHLESRGFLLGRGNINCRTSHGLYNAVHCRVGGRPLADWCGCQPRLASPRLAGAAAAEWPRRVVARRDWRNRFCCTAGSTPGWSLS